MTDLLVAYDDMSRGNFLFVVFNKGERFAFTSTSVNGKTFASPRIRKLKS